MKYLIKSAAHGSYLENLDADTLKTIKEKLTKALGDGSLDCAYTYTGGGGFVVANSSSHEALNRVLRQMGVKHCSVVPVHETAKVVDAHIDYASKNS